MKTINLELDEDFLKRFFDLTGDTVPETITTVTLKKQVINIRERFKKILSDSNGESIEASQKQQTSRPISNNNIDIDEYDTDSDVEGKRKVLIIDNLGVITYQVQMIATNLDFHVISTKEVYSALSLFEEKKFDIVIMDLYIPTEREGFILLSELKKKAKEKETVPVIGVLSVGGKKELKVKSLSKGADFYVEKTLNWQKRLKDIIASYAETPGE